MATLRRDEPPSEGELEATHLVEAPPPSSAELVAVEWESGPAAPGGANKAPSDRAAEPSASRPTLEVSSERAIREHIRQSLAGTPASAPVSLSPVSRASKSPRVSLSPHSGVSRSGLSYAPGPRGGEPSAVRPTTDALSTPSRTSSRAAEAEGVARSYVIASLFFLAIALIGFGLWLSIKVISL